MRPDLPVGAGRAASPDEIAFAVNRFGQGQDLY